MTAPRFVSSINDYSKIRTDYTIKSSRLSGKCKAFWGDAEATYRFMKFAQTVFEMAAVFSKSNPALAQAFSKYALGANIIKSVGQPILRTAKAWDYLANTKVHDGDPQLRQMINVFGPWMFSVFSVVPFASFLGKYGLLPQGDYLKVCEKLGLYGGGVVGNLCAGAAGIYTGMLDINSASNYRKEYKKLEEDEKSQEKMRETIKELHYAGYYDLHGGIKYMLEFAATVVPMALPPGSNPLIRQSCKFIANGYGVFVHSGYKHFFSAKANK